MAKSQIFESHTIWPYNLFLESSGSALKIKSKEITKKLIRLSVKRLTILQTKVSYEFGIQKYNENISFTFFERNSQP